MCILISVNVQISLCSIGIFWSAKSSYSYNNNSCNSTAWSPFLTLVEEPWTFDRNYKQNFRHMNIFQSISSLKNVLLFEIFFVVYLNKMFVYLNKMFVYLNKIFVYLKNIHVYLKKMFFYLNKMLVYLNKIFVYLNKMFVYLNKMFACLNKKFVYLNKMFVYLNKMFILQTKKVSHNSLI